MARGRALKYAIAKEIIGSLSTVSGILSRIDPDIELVRGPAPYEAGSMSAIFHVKTRTEGMRSFEVRIRELS